VAAPAGSGKLITWFHKNELIALCGEKADADDYCELTTHHGVTERQTATLVCCGIDLALLHLDRKQSLLPDVFYERKSVVPVSTYTHLAHTQQAAKISANLPARQTFIPDSSESSARS
jgi:hypothetical protein